MTLNKLKFTLFIFAAIFCFSLIAPLHASAQKRDHLNEAEVELVRDAQAIDQRTEIFVKAIDRRFAVLNGETAAAPKSKKPEKDADKWGDMPTGTRLQLLTDIRKILAEAIDNIDDVAAHDRMDQKMFPKAVRKLAEASNRYLPQLKFALEKTIDEKEKGAILSSIESCEQVIEASAKVPKEESKESKKKSGN